MLHSCYIPHSSLTLLHVQATSTLSFITSFHFQFSLSLLIVPYTYDTFSVSLSSLILSMCSNHSCSSALSTILSSLPHSLTLYQHLINQPSPYHVLSQTYHFQNIHPLWCILICSPCLTSINNIGTTLPSNVPIVIGQEY